MESREESEGGVEPMEVEELRLEEFAAWMRKQRYAEATIKSTIDHLKAAAKWGEDSPSRAVRHGRRRALHLYKKFEQEVKGHDSD